MKKNKMMARLAAAMIGSAMVFTTVAVSPMMAMAEDAYPGFTPIDEEINNVLYKWDGTTLILTGTETVEYVRYCIDGLEDAKKIIVQGEFTAIDSAEFSNLQNLEEVIITAPVTKIDNNTFMYDSKLTKVELPAGLKEIGTDAFKGCGKLVDIQLPVGLTKLGGSAFQECYSLKNLWIPDTVTTLGNNVAKGQSAGLSQLTDVKFPENITAIPERSLENTAVASVHIPDSVTAIQNFAFAGAKLRSVDIPAKVTSIGNGAFSKMPTLTEVRVWSDVPAALGDGVFSADSSTTITVKVPKGCKAAYEEKWKNISGTTTLTFAELDVWESEIELQKKYTNAYTDEDITTIDFTDSVPVTVTAITDGAPAFGTIAPIAVDAANASGSIQLPSSFAKTGDYWYTLKEIAGTTAGVTYDTATTYYLHLVTKNLNGANRVVEAALHTTQPDEEGTFSDDDKKNSGLTNKYAEGSLTIKKVLDANSYNVATEDDRYTVTITLTAPVGKTVNTVIKYNDGADKTIEAGWTGEKTILVYMKKDGTVTFNNIPDGMTYKIVESELVDYDLPTFTFDKTEEGDTVTAGDAWADRYATGTISDAADIVTITNSKSITVDVGVLLENAPYLMLLAGAAVAGVLVFTRRKRTYEE